MHIKNPRYWLTALILALATQTSVSAHPGGVNGDGCHTNRKTGEYHCHPERVKTTAAPASIISEPALPPVTPIPAVADTVATETPVTPASKILKLDYQGFTV